MNTKDTLKQAYVINKNKIQVMDYQFITEEFGVWEKIRCQYIKIFDSTKLQNFYFDCGIKKYSKEIKNIQAGWYNEESKKLTHLFAIDLHILLKNIFIIQPILEETFASIDKNQGSPLRPLPIEFVFHTLLTQSSIESYPFTVPNLSKNVDASNDSNVSKKNTEKIQAYLKGITVLNGQKVNDEYAEWISLYKLYDSCILEFLRRFYAYVSLSQEATESLPWNAVSISAVGHYLGELYDSINGITTTDEGLKVLLALNESLALYDSKKFQLSKDQITEAWQKISSMIKKFQNDDIVFKLTMIALHDPSIGRSLKNNSYYVFEQFQQEMPERVKKLPAIIKSQVFSDNLKNIIEKTNKTFGMKILEIGIYSVENSNKIQTLGLNPFPYVILFAAVKIWLLRVINSWFMHLFSFLLADNSFTKANKDKMEKLYRKLSEFIKEFDKFYNQVNPQLVANKKMVLFLQGAKITEGEKHLVKVLIYDINDRAEALVKDIRPLLIELNNFANLALVDFKDKTMVLLKDTEAIKKTNGDIEEKLRTFLAFLAQLDSILALIDKTNKQ